MSHDLLFVDDDPLFLSRCKELFADSPYQLHFAPSAAKGLDLLHNGLEPVVVLSGAEMPDINGPTFLTKVKGLYPITPRIMVAGTFDPALVMQAVNQSGLFRFYTKDVADAEVKRGVLAAVSYCLHRRQSLETAKDIVGINEDLEDLTTDLERTVEDHSSKLSKSNDENSRLNEVLKTAVRELEGRDRILRHLLTVHQLDDTLQTILEVINDVLCISYGVIHIKDEKGELYQTSVYPKDSDHFAGEVSSMVKDAISGGKMEVTDHSKTNYTGVAVPIYKNDTVLGAIEVLWLKGDGSPGISEDELIQKGQSLYNFTVHTAIAICDSHITKDKTSWGETLDDVLMDFME